MTDETEIIEGEAVEVVEEDEVSEPGRELQVVPVANTSLIPTDSPAEFIIKATEVADALADVIKRKGLSKKIGPKEYVFYEGWTALGALIGATMGGSAITPVLEWSRPVVDADGTQLGWEARVVAQTMDGRILSAAESQCLYSETRWKDADDYAVRSMAQTRAGGKALRQPLGFIMVLAGYDATPTEERESAPPPPPRKKAPKKIVDELTAALTTLGSYDDRWTIPAVVENARRKWGPEINGLADLTTEEATQIIKAAQGQLTEDAQPATMEDTPHA